MEEEREEGKHLGSVFRSHERLKGQKHSRSLQQISLLPIACRRKNHGEDFDRTRHQIDDATDDPFQREEKIEAGEKEKILPRLLAYSL